MQIIKSCLGDNEVEWFISDIKGLFSLINWIVPYLNYTVFWQHTKQYKRMWLLIYCSELDSGVEARERLSWKEIRKMRKSSLWKIG